MDMLGGMLGGMLGDMLGEMLGDNVPPKMRNYDVCLVYK